MLISQRTQMIARGPEGTPILLWGVFRIAPWGYAHQYPGGRFAWSEGMKCLSPRPCSAYP